MQLALVPPGALGSMNEHSLSRSGKGFLSFNLRFVMVPHCWSVAFSCPLYTIRVAKDDFGFLTLPSKPSECCDYRCVPHRSVYI